MLLRRCSQDLVSQPFVIKGQRNRLIDPHLAPDEWIEEAPRSDGSCWPTWQRRLAECSSARAKPPAMGAPKKGCKLLDEAPGQYVRR